MRKTHAVLLVQSGKVFDWLGHMPILNWSVSQILEVRGIDHVVCAASRAFAQRAREMLVKEEIDTVSIPDNLLKQPEHILDRWLSSANGPVALADIVCVVRPTSPFLPAAKIEGCVDTVRRNLADTCCTVQEVRTCNGHGRSTAYAETAGCRVFAPARISEDKVFGRFRHVKVSLIESLDVVDADNHRVALALVAEGTV